MRNNIRSLILAALALTIALAAHAQRAQDGPMPLPAGARLIPSTTTTTTQIVLPGGPANPNAMLVGYLPNYKGVHWAAYVDKIDFTKMTHMNLAFGNPPKCNPAPCTAQSDMTFSLGRGQTDADVDAAVAAAHAHHVKVLISIGGGGGDQMILQFYNVPGLNQPLIDSLDAYMKKHNIDGVDLDQESQTNFGQDYTDFVTALVAKFHPEGKLVTAAVAQYLEASIQDAALKQFDFINVMVYSSLARGVEALKYYNENKKIPKEKITLGVGFFATSADGKEKEEDYAKVLAAYPNAWKVDLVGGGPLDDGRAFRYAGEDTMAKEVQLGKQYGGIMIWEMMGDAPAPHSLYDIIKANF